MPHKHIDIGTGRSRKEVERSRGGEGKEERERRGEGKEEREEGEKIGRKEEEKESKW